MENTFDINIQKSLFVKALSHIQSIVERKNIESISSHLKLEAENNILIITAIDNTISITESLEAEVFQSGAITLPAHTLYEIVRKFSDETIRIKVDKNQSAMAEVSSGYSVFSLPFLSASDFPKIDVGNFECKFSVSSKTLHKIFEKNKNTISQEDGRYHLNGIFIHNVQDSSELRATATDGHRLSSVKTDLPKEAENIPSIIIPRKTVFEILKIIADNSSDILFEVSPVKIRLTIGTITIVSKLIDADFPDYLGLIPYNNKLHFSISSVEMSRAVDRVSTVMMEKSQAIKLIISGTRLELQAGGVNQSLGNETLEIESNIDSFEISFNAKYLLDIMASIDNSESVEFKFSDPYSAVLIQSKEDDKTDFVIMPMRA